LVTIILIAVNSVTVLPFGYRSFLSFLPPVSSAESGNMYSTDCPSVHPSVCLSVRGKSQQKKTPSKTLVFGDTKMLLKFEGCHHQQNNLYTPSAILGTEQDTQLSPRHVTLEVK